MRAGERNGDDSSVTGEIDLARIARAISAKRWWVIGPTLAMFAGSAIFVNVVKPRYSAEARVLLENQENFIPRADKTERVAEILPDPEAVQSQIQLLTSRDLARRVIKTLDLQGNDEFDPLAKGMGATTRALVMLGLARDPTQTTPEDRILETFGDKLNVLSPTKTRVLSIEFTSRNPDLAARAPTPWPRPISNFSRTPNATTRAAPRIHWPRWWPSCAPAWRRRTWRRSSFARSPDCSSAPTTRRSTRSV